MTSPPRSGIRLLLLCLVLVTAPARALDRISLSLGDLQGAGWSLQELSLDLDWREDGGLRARLRAARASLPPPLGEVHDLQLDCARLELQASRIRCQDGRLQAESDWLPGLSAGLGWELDRGTGALQVQLRDLRTPHGRLDMALQLQDGAWQATLDIHELELAGLPALAAPWYAEAQGWNLQGRLQGRLRLGGRDTTPASLVADLQLRDLGYANAAGDQAGEGLTLRLQAEGKTVSTGWELELQAHAGQGQLYAAPMFLEFDPAAALELQASLASGKQGIAVTTFRWEHPGILRAAGTARLAAEGMAPEQVQLDIEQAIFPGAFTTYLQPWLLDTSFFDLGTRGELMGGLHYQDGGITQLQLELQEVSVDDPRDRFQVEGLAGRFDWADDDQERRQQLRWTRAQLYRVALGALDVDIQTRGRQVNLAAPARLPVLDGNLLVDHFALDYGTTMDWSLDATLTPISMTALTQALDWPEMAGTLSGMIPSVRYVDGELQVGGTLLVGAFDGDITVRNLRMEQPLGVVPRLWADILIDRIDLETLTRTFSFGRIEGRLNGAIEGLRLEAWKPVAFDAWLATPEDDRSRQRISQRAVDNLTNIGGGGVGGALSRGFLRFLEDFPYQAIGLRCRLENGICHMGGVAPAERGYYLVKGRFLPPRIDVIGYEEWVDWESLLERLRTVTAEEGPVVR
ncbi:MAG TPA: hypothetical protein VLA26_04130 [Gammaproteobacteria bacterium]|nr:hypothetical protein [Gammaproteobacteria bacterium]